MKLMDRCQILNSIFPRGVPPLWCPPLTHYTAEGALDQARLAAHLRFMSPWVKGLLVPGTTGDAWELTPEEIRELISLMLEQVPRWGLHLLWGALHPDAAQAWGLVEAGLKTLQQRHHTEDNQEALARSCVCGFAVCPPRGSNVSPEEMELALSRILESGLPLALYQLPQFTQNEISPALAVRLAACFPNFILLKDTSGTDRIATSGLSLGNVFLVRGMEGGYARWLKAGGGCYDGFLLSSANSFCQQLHQLRELLEQGQPQEAHALSDRLTSLINKLFDIVAAVPGGNKFANANKVADHFFAHGPRAVTLPPPRLHSGRGLSVEMLRAAATTLEQHRLMPARGYLE